MALDVSTNDAAALTDTDLDDYVPTGDATRSHDGFCRLPVDEKILTKPFFRRQPVGLES